MSSIYDLVLGRWRSLTTNDLPGGGGGGGGATTVADGADVAQGVTTATAAAADGTGNYSLIAAAKRGLLNWATLLARIPTLGAKAASGSLSITPATDASFAIAPSGFRSAAAISRPANVTAYTAGDVVGGALTFASAGPTASNVILTSCDLRYDVSAIPSGMAGFRLYLYTATPPSAYADNAAWDLPSGDRASFVGFIDLGSPADLGSTLFAQVDGVNKQVQLAAGQTSLFGYLVTLAGYTPAANSETAQVTLRSVVP